MVWTTGRIDGATGGCISLTVRPFRLLKIQYGCTFMVVVWQYDLDLDQPWFAGGESLICPSLVLLSSSNGLVVRGTE